ncbi:MAG: FAD-binding oxidoreductase, partial [Candidatus Adiutrix sp.]
MIIYPDSPKQIAETMKMIGEKGQKLLPAGGLTKLKKNLPTLEDRQISVISLKNLNKTITIEPENLLATVEAGQNPQTLNEALKPTGLYWPLSARPNRSIGAIMAQGLMGVETICRGPMVDWVLGATFITASGKTITSGGRTLKNVSGYDLTRLMWRCHGRLALGLSFILKLLPRPLAHPVFEFALPTVNHGVKLAKAIITQRLWPEAVVFDLSPKGASLLVWLTGFPEVVDFKAKKICELAGDMAHHTYDDGFAFWANYGQNLPDDAPDLLTIASSRKNILNLVQNPTP